MSTELNQLLPVVSGAGTRAAEEVQTEFTVVLKEAGASKLAV
jgi:large subunit ribosomal protein L7/L12